MLFFISTMDYFFHQNGSNHISSIDLTLGQAHGLISRDAASEQKRTKNSKTSISEYLHLCRNLDKRGLICDDTVLRRLD